MVELQPHHWFSLRRKITFGFILDQQRWKHWLRLKITRNSLLDATERFEKRLCFQCLSGDVLSLLIRIKIKLSEDRLSADGISKRTEALPASCLPITAHNYTERIISPQHTEASRASKREPDEREDGSLSERASSRGSGPAGQVLTAPGEVLI